MEDLLTDCVDFVVHNTAEINMEGCYLILGSNSGFMIRLGKAIATSPFFESKLRGQTWWNTFKTCPKLDSL
jgi:hypothetical protein